jgi:Zn finger protein HypA/HybF involved in hydrogenase expression
VGAVHELSICSSIAKIVEDATAGRPVELVRLDVGRLRQVVPHTLTYCWDMVVDPAAAAIGPCLVCRRGEPYGAARSPTGRR